VSRSASSRRALRLLADANQAHQKFGARRGDPSDARARGVIA